MIVENTFNNFVLHIYGRWLRNEIVGNVRAVEVGEKCANMAPWIEKHPDVLFIDDLDYTKDCARECKISSWYCRAWKITPPATR